ncbi:MAG: DNA-binding protein [Pseudomonas sp.]|nr:DNA-binding protein [Pseudomonas sp.]
MARGGINKALVKQARQSLLARGENPSIDAVRVELGNTGSKTTIHRYLKALEDTEVDPAAPSLSAQLTTLVAGLADQLSEEAEARVAEAQGRFDAARESLEVQLQASQRSLAALQQRFDIQGMALNTESEALALCRSTLQGEQTRNARLGQANTDLELRIGEKDEHIQSLEDKHRHARDALEHYRTAVKEQREQEQRRHEGQLQQVQVEIRQLQQSLIVKQDELMRLSRDNERMLVQARQASKEQLGLQDELKHMTAQAGGMSTLLAQAAGAREELDRQMATLKGEAVEQRQHLAKALNDVAQLQAAIQHQASAQEAPAPTE